VQTVTNKYLVTDMIEESPDLLTNQLDENDSDLSLFLFRLGYSVKGRLRTKEVGQRFGGKDGLREVKAFSRVLLQTSYSLTRRLLFDGKAAL
jgi:hypothetical protein